MTIENWRPLQTRVVFNEKLSAERLTTNAMHGLKDGQAVFYKSGIYDKSL